MKLRFILVMCVALSSVGSAMAVNCLSAQERVLVIESVNGLLPHEHSVREVVCIPTPFRLGEGKELLVGTWSDKGPSDHKQYFVTFDGSSWIAVEMNWWLAFNREHESFAIRLLDPVDVLTANQMLDAVRPELEDSERPTSITNLPGVISEQRDDGLYGIAPGPDRLGIRTRYGDKLNGRVFFVEKVDGVFLITRPPGWWVH